MSSFDSKIGSFSALRSAKASSFEHAMQEVTGIPKKKPQLRITIPDMGSLPSTNEPSPSALSDTMVLSFRRTGNTQEDQSPIDSSWEITEALKPKPATMEDVSLKPTVAQKEDLKRTRTIPIPVRKISTGNLTSTLKVRPAFKGVENDRGRSGTLRFSPSTSPTRKRLPVPVSVKKPVSAPKPPAASGKAPTTPSKMKPITPTLAKKLAGPPSPSKIPVSKKVEEDTPDDVSGMEILEDLDGSFVIVDASEIPLPPSTPVKEMSEYGIEHPVGQIDKIKVDVLRALGFNDPVFNNEENFLQDIAQLVERISSQTYTGEKEYDIIEFKIKELIDRIAVIHTLYNAAKEANAPENEMLCLTGWGDSLLRELDELQQGTIKYHPVWIRHIVDWLWGLENINRRQILAISCSSLPTPDFHPLFNLPATTDELMREGMHGNEKKAIRLWGDIRGIPFVASACGKTILHEYICRLTRYDGDRLEGSQVQERRMEYFCLRHFSHWKAAVSHYSIALKIMNLLIVVHDLWGMHVDGMSMQEKKDFGALHDNLYDFACCFEKPTKVGDDTIWKECECYQCFSLSAADTLDADRHKSVWYWLLLLSGVAGYGAYHASLLQLMTAGKKPDYVNGLLDQAYYQRQSSMVMAMKRIMAATRKDGRIGALIRPLGTISVNINPITHFGVSPPGMPPIPPVQPMKKTPLETPSSYNTVE